MIVPIAAVGLLIWLILTFGRAGFWRFRQGRSPARRTIEGDWPRIVAIVPARNEAAHIGGCVRSLLLQDYPGRLSVVVVNDSSTDATASVAAEAARECGAAERLSVVDARPLPGGWTGKVWAQSEGLEHVRKQLPDGTAPVQFLWFTDADIVHRARVLEGLVTEAVDEKLVLNSHMVHLRCTSFAERALIPAFVFFFAMLYPFGAVSDPRRRIAAAAGGSMLIEARALDAAGGFASIRGALIDDCALGALLKQHGRIRLALGHASFSIRPYPGFADIWKMVARTAYTQLNYSPLVLIGTVLGLCLTYLAPPVIALTAHGLAAALAGLAWLLMAICFVPIARHYRRSPAWGVALPLIATFYLSATLGSAWQYTRGRGGQWKDRHQAGAATSATPIRPRDVS